MSKNIIFSFEVEYFVFCFFWFLMDELVLNNITLIFSVDMNVSM
jgi:hypothetical protein